MKQIEQNEDPKSYNEGHLKVSEEHKIFYHQYGKPDGPVILHIHGGPGSSSKPKYASLYNLKKFRVILFDQRGCGNSITTDLLKDNTTQDLVEDIEKLRKHLKINTWKIHGPSWGSTLALLYVQKYPKTVEKMLLRGVYFASSIENQWIFKYGANQLFPDKFEEFISQIPSEHREKYLSYLYEIAKGDDYNLKSRLLPAFGKWEGSILSLVPEDENDDHTDIDKEIASNTIMLHYVNNNFFMKDHEILEPKSMEKLKDIPIVIINGRYDIVTPMISAWILHKALPHSVLDIVLLAGHHGSTDKDMVKAIQKRIDFDF